MTTLINALPIALDRKATIYGEGTDWYTPVPDHKVILTTDGSNVEYLTSCIVDFSNPPFNALQITLDMTVAEFEEWTHGQDTYVDIVLLKGGKVGVFITTVSDVIYDEQHELN